MLHRVCLKTVDSAQHSDIDNVIKIRRLKNSLASWLKINEHVINIFRKLDQSSAPRSTRSRQRNVKFVNIVLRDSLIACFDFQPVL